MTGNKILDFFRDNPGFERMLHTMYDTLIRNGRVFGAARLRNPTASEESALSAFFGRDYFNQAMIRISLADFERQILKNFPEESDGLELSEILSAYIGISPPKKKPAPAPPRPRPTPMQKGTLATVIAKEILPPFENTPAHSWLSEVSRQARREYRAWSEQHMADSKAVTAQLETVANAFNNLPRGERLMPLAEFSQKFGGSPFDFDFHTSQGKLFLRALAFAFSQPAPASTEDAIHLHRLAGLLSCGKISGVIMRTLRETRMLTLEEVDCIEISPPEKVFVFEDPLIFNAVCDRLGDFDCMVVAPVNEPGAAFMYLLEKLASAALHYAGNMTITGLQTADRLYARLGKAFVPWRYSREDFQIIAEQNSQPLPSEKKQLSLHNEELASMLSIIRKSGKTASSMPLLPQYVDDIRGNAP